MDQQNPSSHSLISSNLAAAAAAGFPTQLAGLNNGHANVAQNPLLMSTLQQLGFTANSNLLQTPQISLNGQFTADLSNVSWNNQPATASWLDQAKVAAMYNSMLQSTVNDHAQTQLESMVEQSLKAAAAAAARAPQSMSSTALNLATQQANVNAFTNATMPIMAAAVAAAAVNPLSSIPNSFFSAVDTVQPPPPVLDQNSLQPNITAVSATIMMPNSSSINSFAASSSSFTDTSKNLQSFNSFAFPSASTSIPISSSPPLCNPIPLKTSAIDNFNISSMIASEPMPSTSNNLYASTSLPISSNNTHIPLSLSPYQTQPSTSTIKDHQIDDLSIFDFNDMDIFAPKPSNSIPAIYSALSLADTKTPPQTSYSAAPMSSSKTLSKPSGEIETEKELDQWLSLAVGGNLPEDDAPVSPLFGDVASRQVDLFPTEATGFCLDPVMFTPPDSPTEYIPEPKKSKNQASPSVEPLFPKPTPTVLPETPKSTASTEPIIDIFMSAKPKDRSAANKVPIYKQKKNLMSASFTLEKALNKVSKKVTDEYSFTDDEEEEQKCSGFDFFEEDNKTQDYFSDSEEERIQDQIEVNTKKKTELKVGKSDDANAIPKVERNHVAETIRTRRQKLFHLESVFMYSEITDGNDVVRPVAYEVNTPNANEEFVSDDDDDKPDLELMEDIVNEDAPGSPSSSEPSPIPSTSIYPIKREESDITPYSNEMEIEEKTNVKEEINEPERIIPKLVIKIRRESVTSPIHKKKKHKKKRKKRDEDWEPSDRKKKKRKHKHRHDESRKSREHAKTSIVPSIIMPSEPLLIRQFVNGHQESSSKINDPWIQERLNCFGNASGDSPKGTFVVCKQDIFKDDCPLWKVDNQNLLQKYPQISDDENIGTAKRYKNSSTYSGWCDQVAAGYLRVEVKYHKHSRAETVVEPQIPLIDLIPAITDGVSGIDSYGLKEEPTFNDIFEPQTTTSVSMISTSSTVRSHMLAFTQAMLRHAATMDFLQNVKTCNDWDYLCALNEVDNMTLLGKQKINDRVRWGQRFEVMLTIYANVGVSNEYDEDEVCQACGDKMATKYLNLFSNESYDYDSLEIQALPEVDGDAPLVAMQFCVCTKCANLAFTYHRLHHMRYTTFRYCEDMIENMSALRPDLPLDSLVSLCLSKRSWQRKLINDYAILWHKVQDNEF